MKNKHKWYFQRLWNAILGREYREEYYIYSLKDFILDLVEDFIDKDKQCFPSSYTEHSWEKKLKGVKQSIIKHRELDEKGWDIDNQTAEECIEEYNKAQRKMLRDIMDIFPNLWD